MSAFRSPVARALAVSALAALALFATAARAGAVPADSAQFVPYVHVGVDPPHPCAGDSVRLVVTDSCGPCLSVVGADVANLRAVFRLEPLSVCEANPCAARIVRLPLGRHSAGNYLASVTIVIQVPADSTNAAREISLREPVSFVVGDSCPVVPPNPVPLPFVEHVTLAGATAPCDTCPPRVCALQPIEVQVSGHMPNSCYVYRGAHFLPIMSAPFDRPIVELEFAAACDQPCAMHTVEFTGGFTLPPVLAGLHSFDLLVAVNSCPDTLRNVVGHGVFAYEADSCAAIAEPACVWPWLFPVPALGDLTDGCDLKLAPGKAGTQAFAARADSVAIGGLQGTIFVSPGLHLLDVQPRGAAAGMHLVTHALAGGDLAFVLYGDGSTTIPPGYYEPVLAITVKADSSLSTGTRGSVGVSISAASDSSGRAIPICQIEAFAAVVAHVCIVTPASCDANGDGYTNVADLVRMARCWLHPETCPDSAAARPDCNSDGAFGVADILCCARSILGGGPPDSTRTASGFSIGFGDPTLDQGVVHVALDIRGATAMNGALLHVRFPADRYAFVPSADTPGAGAHWLPLTESGYGDVVVGVLRLDDAAPDVVTVPLGFRVLDGQSAGGTLTADQGQVIAPDGSSIAVDLGGITASLPTGGATSFARVELLCGPNPSSGPTRFAIRLPSASPVDLGIYDVAGRRVDTVFRGALAAGETSFTWQPRGVHGGIFFARLAVNGVVRTTRVTLRVAR